ncbi:MAG: glycosyltransferase family 2 protein [Parcubacteria group bacterium]|nr:glycosyltransferase family 2 protein [Parcubacteria group bacterium]
MDSVRDIATLTALFFSLYFEIFMLITYLERRKILHERVRLPTDTHAGLPGVTIIVPCYNEENTLTKTVESLLNVDYPKDKLHILAINDGSTDDTALVLKKYIGHPQIKVINKENGGKHTVLNLGIARATTDFVGCLDADSYAKPDALIRLMRRFENPLVMAVVPSLHVSSAETLIQKMQLVEYVIGTFLRSILGELNALYVTPGPFSIFRKSVFETIGYYKQAHNTEDMEMALRMQSHGLMIASAHDAVVYTSSPRTPKTLYRQRVRWVSGFLNNVRDYRHMLFRFRYGHIGGFILPMMLLSTATVLFVVSMFAYDIFLITKETVFRFEALNTKIFELSHPIWNWFFFYTSPALFAGAAVFFVLLCFIIIGATLSKSNYRLTTFDIACYAFLYSLIAPFWIIRSLANVALRKQSAWR